MIWISDEWKDYEVLDTSDGERLERWGKYILVRPDPQVIWNTPKELREWRKYDARYIRSNTGGGHWSDHKLPERWQIHYKDYLTFNVKPMNFKHTGVFPEQAANWDFIRDKVASAGRPVRVLNLFAYSGGATLAAAAGGADKLREKPIVSFIACSVPLLTFKHMDAEILLRCARAGVPVQPCSLPTAGANTPVTAQGTALVQRQAHDAALLCDGLQDALANPPYGIGDKFESARFVEFLSSLYKSQVTFVD